MFSFIRYFCRFTQKRRCHSGGSYELTAPPARQLCMGLWWAEFFTFSSTHHFDTWIHQRSISVGMNCEDHVNENLPLKAATVEREDKTLHDDLTDIIFQNAEAVSDTQHLHEYFGRVRRKLLHWRSHDKCVGIPLWSVGVCISAICQALHMKSYMSQVQSNCHHRELSETTPMLKYEHVHELTWQHK